MKSIAILLDGGFVRHRLYGLLGRRHATADDIVRLSMAICRKDEEDLFRIYYYDCPPHEGRAVNPLLNRAVDFGNTPTARRSKSLHDTLARKDHVAFRRGELLFQGWGFNTQLAGEFMRATTLHLSPDRRTFEIRIALDLEHLEKRGLLNRAALPSDEAKAAELIVSRIVKPELEQKRVDIKIGLDVAWLSSRRIVDRIALVTADTDFIPAMKFARREGVQVVLVPLGHRPSPDLIEHADEVRSVAVPPVPPPAEAPGAEG